MHLLRDHSSSKKWHGRPINNYFRLINSAIEAEELNYWYIDWALVSVGRRAGSLKKVINSNFFIGTGFVPFIIPKALKKIQSNFQSASLYGRPSI